MHVGEREFLFALCLDGFLVLGAEVRVEATALTPLAVFIGGHDDGRVEVAVAQLRADDILVERVVVFHFLLHVVGQAQVVRATLQVVLCDGRGALYLPAWMEQRVGNGVFLQVQV